MFRSLVALCALLLPALAPAFTLVEDGAPKAIIILPDHPKPAETFAAEELRHHIKLATGAELPILADHQSMGRPEPTIQVGQTRAFRELGVRLPQPEPFALGKENYPWAGKLVGGKLHFYGVDGPGAVPAYGEKGPWDSTPTGTLFAVYDFLEKELGVRWIWPGPTGEIVPPRPTLSVESYDRSGEPRFINTLWRSEHVLTLSKTGWHTPEARREFLDNERLWLLRHRFRRLAPTSSFEGLIGKKEYHRHRDIVAMTPDGKRGVYYRDNELDFKRHGWNRVSTCVSSPELPGLYVKYWKETLKNRATRSNTSIVAFSENDIPAYCFCTRCRAWDAADPGFKESPYWRGEVHPKSTVEMWQALSTRDPRNPSLTDRYAKFWLAGLKAAQAWRPDASINVIGYLNWSQPPKETKLNEHIHVGIVGWPYLTWLAEDTDAINRLWDEWAATGATLRIRPNSTCNGHNLPVFYGHWFARAFNHAAANGLEGTDLDTLTGQWGVQGPTLYLIARIHAEPGADPEAVEAEFYAGFGPAQKEVAAYFAHWKKVAERRTRAEATAESETLRERWEKYGTSRVGRLLVAAPPFKPEVVAEGKPLLAAAVAAAANDPAAAARVRVLELGFEHMEKTLATLATLQRFAETHAPADRASLKEATTALQAFRRAHERELISDLGWLTNEENGYWGETALKRLTPQKASQAASASGEDAE